MVSGNKDVRIINASLDRFEGDYAVVYDNINPEQKYDVPRSLARGIRAGSQVRLHLQNEVPVKVEFDPQAIEALRKKLQDKYKRLLRGEHLKK